MSLTVRMAIEADAQFLPAIEIAAGKLFRTMPDIAWVADAEVGSPSTNLPFIAASTLWVADDAGTPVGFLRAEIAGDELHILELAVADTHQNKGLGHGLLDASVAEARTRGLAAVTLTTFRHVPWNRPFYARYGFRELSVADIGERLHAIVRNEEDNIGLPNRCAMRFTL